MCGEGEMAAMNEARSALDGWPTPGEAVRRNITGSASFLIQQLTYRYLSDEILEPIS